METSNLSVKRNIKVFDVEKHSIWKFRIRAVLSELDVIKVIDEKTLEGVEPSDSWKKAERIVKSVIVDYLADSFLSFVTPTSTAKQILKNLDNFYERKSIATQLALRKKLLGQKLQKNSNLIKHFTLFDDLIGCRKRV